jgi:hypothetical protein
MRHYNQLRISLMFCFIFSILAIIISPYGFALFVFITILSANHSYRRILEIKEYKQRKSNNLNKQICTQ